MTHNTRLSKKIAAIAESATLKVDSKAKALQAEGRPVISYAAGEPDFSTPSHIVEAAREKGPLSTPEAPSSSASIRPVLARWVRPRRMPPS